MSDLNSLPHVPQHQIEEMNRIAEKKFGVRPEAQEMAPQQAPQQPVYETIFPQSGEVEETQEVQDIPEPKSEPAWTQPEPETEQARNFKAIKERARQLERERDEAIKIAKQYQERVAPQAQEPEEIDTFGMNPDDLVEGKHLSKVAKEMKKLREELKQYKQQTYQQTTETKLKMQYPDIEKVLTAENIETFQYAYPELASTIASSPDDYTRAVSAYTMLKKFGVYQETGISPEKELSQKNLAKPRPVASVSPQQGDSPLSRANAFANGLTKEVKDQMWKDIQNARKGY